MYVCIWIYVKIIIISLSWKSSRKTPDCETYKASSWQGIVCVLSIHSLLLLSMHFFKFSLFCLLIYFNTSFPTGQRGLGSPEAKIVPCIPPGCDTVVKSHSLLWFFCVEINFRLLMFSFYPANRPSFSHTWQHRHWITLDWVHHVG